MAAEKQTAYTTPLPPAAPADARPARKKSLFIVAALMLVEGVALYFGMKMLSGAGPAAADASAGSHGAETASQQGGDQGGDHNGDPAKNAPFASEFGEVLVSECRPTNRTSGRLITFRMRVSVLVRADDLEKTKNLVEANKARIEDRINFIIRSAEAEYLYEATLDTIKRRIKSELDRVLGDGHLVEEVLIPEMLASAPGL